MKTFRVMLVGGVSLAMLASCSNHMPEPPPTRQLHLKDGETISYTPLGHTGRQLHVNGETREQILKRWGKPRQKLRADFRESYQVVKLPAFDEQWVYSMYEGMGCRVVHFNEGRVVCCIEEWSCW